MFAGAFDKPDFVLGVRGTQPLDTCLCSQGEDTCKDISSHHEPGRPSQDGAQIKTFCHFMCTIPFNPRDQPVRSDHLIISIFFFFQMRNLKLRSVHNLPQITLVDKDRPRFCPWCLSLTLSISLCDTESLPA